MKPILADHLSAVDIEYTLAIEAWLDQGKRINADYERAKAVERRRSSRNGKESRSQE